MLRATYVPTFSPSPHFPSPPFPHSRKTPLHQKKATPRHPHVYSLVLTRRPRASNTQFSLEPAGMGLRCGAVRCGAVRYARKQQHPDIRPRIPTRARKSSGQCTCHMTYVRGLACREVLRRWMPTMAFSSARLVSAQVGYVCVYACAGCVQARRMPCWTYGRIGVRWLVSWCGV
jgi:hypothetical protein